MANLKDVIYLSNEDYAILVSTGTVTINGTTLTYNENNLYITPEENATQTQNGLMSAADKIKVDSLKTVATTGSYNDLTNKPTLGTAASKNFTSSVTSGSADLVTSGAVWSAIDSLPEPMIFKGTLGTGGTITTLPAAATSNEGYTYKVITAGTYQSIVCKVGDVLTSNGSAWVLIPSGDTDSDTWRTIKVNGTQLLGNGISTGAVNFKNGSNITITGSGNDITIAGPTVNNAALTIQRNGTTVKTFTANSSTDVTANITVPTVITDIGGWSTVGTVAASTVPIATTVNSSSTNSQIPTALAVYNALALAPGISSVTTTGSGNGVTAVDYNSSTHILTVTKGSTFSLNGHSHTATIGTTTSTSPSVTLAYDTNYQLNVDSQNAFIFKTMPKPAYTLDEVSDGTTRKLANYLPLTGGTLLNSTAPQLIIASALTGSGGKAGIKFLRGNNTAWEEYVDGGNFYLKELTSNSIALQINESGQYSGNYSRPLVYGNKLAYLSDIPTVNNATLTIQKNGSTVKTFTANSATDVTANITVPTKVSELSNDSGFVTSSGVTSITINTSGTGLSGGSATAITSTGTRTITLDSSSAGNAAANKVVLRSATGTLQSEKYAVSSGTTTKATMQYNTTDDCIEFVFA